MQGNVLDIFQKDRVQNLSQKHLLEVPLVNVGGAAPYKYTSLRLVLVMRIRIQSDSFLGFNLIVLGGHHVGLKRVSSQCVVIELLLAPGTQLLLPRLVHNLRDALKTDGVTASGQNRLLLLVVKGFHADGAIKEVFH